MFQFIDFIDVTIVDLIDIVLMAMILFQVYRLTKGTNALRIVVGILIVYILWIVVRILKMELLSMILGQIIGVGVIAIIIVFQQEIRRFLLLLGTQYSHRRKTIIGKLFKPRKLKGDLGFEWIDSIVNACGDMAASKTGALIVITRSVSLESLIERGGEVIDSRITAPLLKSIFFKNSPLHDGAVIIVDDRIRAAKCVLPSTEKDVPLEFGLRHRAALGVTEISDALVVVVSEERGWISLVRKGHIRQNLTPTQLRTHLRKVMMM